MCPNIVISNRESEVLFHDIRYSIGFVFVLLCFILFPKFPGTKPIVIGFVYGKIYRNPP